MRKPPSPNELHKLAEHYRDLSHLIADPQAIRALLELADHYDRTAYELKLIEDVRSRAHEIWIEEGRPEGRRLDHWLRAEREMTVSYRRCA